MAFKVGDIIVLKSGGPKMTVDEADGGNGLWAVWFAGAKRERAHFNTESVALAPVEEPKTK